MCFSVSDCACVRGRGRGPSSCGCVRALACRPSATCFPSPCSRCSVTAALPRARGWDHGPGRHCPRAPLCVGVFCQCSPPESPPRLRMRGICCTLQTNAWLTLDVAPMTSDTRPRLGYDVTSRLRDQRLLGSVVLAVGPGSGYVVLQQPPPPSPPVQDTPCYTHSFCTIPCRLARAEGDP